MKTCIFIPARLQSARLPGKPLADIGGMAMVLRVAAAARNASKTTAHIMDPIIAAADQEIYDCVQNAGYRAVLTDPDLPSGTDRIYAGLQSCADLACAEYILNVQGDMPNISPSTICIADTILRNEPSADMSTLVAKITTKHERDDPNVVKAVLSPLPSDLPFALYKALYFSRAAVPSGPGPLYHHIGIYGYRRAALQRFVGAAAGELEKRECLEQLRALSLGMNIVAAEVEAAPISVDTPKDLDEARKAFGEQDEQ